MSKQKKILNIVLGVIFLILLAGNILVIVCPPFKERLWGFFGDIGSLLKNLSLAYLGSYIFYCFQILMPDLWKSHIEKNYMKQFFDGSNIDGFAVLLKTCYSFPDAQGKIPRQLFYVCEKIPDKKMYVAEIIILQNQDNKKHYVSLTDKISFSEAMANNLESIRRQVEYFRKQYDKKICNEDLLLVFDRIIDNTTELQSLYDNSQRYSTQNTLLGGITDVLQTLYEDLSYIVSRYKIKSERRIEVITNEEEYKKAKSIYDSQIKNGLADLVNFSRQGSKLVFEVNKNAKIFFPIGCFLENRGHKVKGSDEARDITVFKDGKRIQKVKVFGIRNISIGRIIILRHNFTEKDLYWMEDKVVRLGMGNDSIQKNTTTENLNKV
ncbi:hypothetical protein IJ118_00705 [Candidatus Saccharibacteria bacterium]|nr:hypothetical protein [Candidatus Saccharibacteria bacterium]